MDRQVSSMVHRSLQVSRIPTFSEIFLITWPSRAKPSTGLANFRRRQSPERKIELNYFQIYMSPSQLTSCGVQASRHQRTAYWPYECPS